MNLSAGTLSPGMERKKLILDNLNMEKLSNADVNEHSPSPGLKRAERNFRMKYYSAIETGHRHAEAKKEMF